MDRTSETLRGLVRDLDSKLESTAPKAEHRDPEIIRPRFHERVPTWLGFTLVTLIGIMFAFVVVQPWKARCDYDRDLCQIAQLDIDAVRITVPDSQLIKSLPNIDAIDPDDELTVGDILAMDRFSNLNMDEMLTEDEIDQLLGSDG